MMQYVFNSKLEGRGSADNRIITCYSSRVWREHSVSDFYIKNLFDGLDRIGRVRRLNWRVYGGLYYELSGVQLDQSSLQMEPK